MSDKLVIPRECISSIRDMFSTYAKICDHEAYNIEKTLTLLGSNLLELGQEELDKRKGCTLDGELASYMWVCKSVAGLSTHLASSLAPNMNWGASAYLDLSSFKLEVDKMIFAKKIIRSFEQNGGIPFKQDMPQ